MRRISRYLNIVLLTLLTALGSCRDDLWLDTADIPEEGLPASVTLKVNVRDTKPGTRYAGFVPGDVETSTVEDLWVGLFKVSDGSLITHATYNELGLSGVHEEFGTITLNDIPAASGQCYIVAVANTLTNDGVIIDENGSGTRKLISQHLNDVRNWSDFRKISVLLSNPRSVSRVSADFPMCGSYLSSNFEGAHEILDDAGNPEIVNIYPGVNKLTGSVHLQRLDSYVKFVLKPGDNIKITPVSWQVKNLPSTGFLLERKSTETGAGAPLVNAADAPKTGTYWRDEGITTPYFYNDSQVYLANSFMKERDGNSPNGSYSFDFYQMENKHTGIINTTDIDADKVYHEREREFKYPEPTPGEDGELKHDPYERNTGWYKSLVGAKGSDIPAKPSSEANLRNNNATFLELHVQVEYYYEDKGKDTDYSPVDPANYTGENASKLVQRVANAIYNVHLGYVSYNGASPDVNDFNCYRNSSVTYNITIYGADHIRIEAQDNNEITSSVEGTVTDIEGSFFNLDCHYSVFQIELSDKERKDLTWRIRAPYGDNYIDMVNGPNLDGFFSSMITNLGDGKHQDMIKDLPDNQFYNWVHIVPTKVDGKIPQYPGDPRLLKRTDLPSEYSTTGIKGNSKDGVWYLEDLRDIDNFKHPNRGNDGVDENTRLPYTVFIDEYVYDYDYAPGSSTLTASQPMNPIKWQNYVNQDYRKLWIRLGDPNLSYDGESVYSRSLYMMAQESIQTYYNTSAPNCAGIEHINESYTGTKFDGFTGLTYNTVSSSDGLQNLYNYVSNNSTKQIWSNVALDEYQKALAHDGSGYKDATFTVRKHAHNYMDAALARNRDLNGNGKIENFELRWYLPPVSTYTRMMIGAASLKTPLFHMLDYERTGSGITAGTGTLYTHYVSSDKLTLWAEELAATGTYDKGNPGTLRCIRNVGVPVSNSSPIQDMMVAYQYDEKTRIVTMTYYRASSLRPETRGHLPSHYAGSIQSYPAYSFQVAADYCKPLDAPGGNTRNIFQDKYLFPNNDGKIVYKDNYTIEGWTASVNNNAICGGYAEAPGRTDEGEWRMPNISEITIMAFLGILDGKNYRSCTQEYFSGQGYRYMGMNSSKEITAGIDADFYVIAVKDVMQ